MLQGTVKWFSDEKGFGFITDGKEDYFVHFRSIEGEGHRKLAQGEKVSFTPETGAKGKVATRVQLL